MTNEEIVRQIQEGTDKKENLSLLWERNQKLIDIIVRRITGIRPSEEGFEDVKQQAFFGILDAVNTYSPDTGVKFFTHANFRILKALYRYNANCGYLVRVPEYLKIRFQRLRNFKDAYKKAHAKQPTPEECAEALAISREALEDLQKLGNAVHQVRLDSYIGRNDEHKQTCGETLKRDFALDEVVTGSVYLKELHEELNKALEILDSNDRSAILLFFYQGRTVSYIARIQGCSRQNVYDRMKKAFKLIRDSEHGDILQTFRDVPYKPVIEEQKRKRTSIRPAEGISEQEEALFL